MLSDFTEAAAEPTVLNSQHSPHSLHSLRSLVAYLHLGEAWALRLCDLIPRPPVVSGRILGVLASTLKRDGLPFLVEQHAVLTHHARARGPRGLGDAGTVVRKTTLLPAAEASSTCWRGTRVLGIVGERVCQKGQGPEDVGGLVSGEGGVRAALHQVLQKSFRR